LRGRRSETNTSRYLPRPVVQSQPRPKGHGGMGGPPYVGETPGGAGGCGAAQPRYERRPRTPSHAAANANLVLAGLRDWTPTAVLSLIRNRPDEDSFVGWVSAAQPTYTRWVALR